MHHLILCQAFSYFCFFNVAEIDRRLQFHIAMTSIATIDKYTLLTLVEDCLIDLECIPYLCHLSKKLMFQPSSLIERTLASNHCNWFLTSLVRNCICILTIFLENVCIEPVIPKVKEPLSTSPCHVCHVWTVTIQQSPKAFVDLISTYLSIACGKVLSCSCDGILPVQIQGLNL